MSNQSELTRTIEGALFLLEQVSTDRLYNHELSQFMAAEVLLVRAKNLSKELENEQNNDKAHSTVGKDAEYSALCTWV